MQVGTVLGEILSGMARELARGSGPLKWCKVCGRKHGSRARCHLIEVEATAKSGRMVKRKARP